MNGLKETESISEVRVRGGETILVVEDDESLLRLLRFFLVDAGYQVMSATSGEMAVEMYIKHCASIDLVITDLGLPRLTGKEEVVMMKHINANVRIICASGFIVPGVEEEMVKAGAKAMVQKPYAPEEVLSTVRSVLDIE